MDPAFVKKTRRSSSANTISQYPCRVDTHPRYAILVVRFHQNLDRHNQRVDTNRRAQYSSGKMICPRHGNVCENSDLRAFNMWCKAQLELRRNCTWRPTCLSFLNSRAPPSPPNTATLLSANVTVILDSVFFSYATFRDSWKRIAKATQQEMATRINLWVVRRSQQGGRLFCWDRSRYFLPYLSEHALKWFVERSHGLMNVGSPTQYMEVGRLASPDDSTSITSPRGWNSMQYWLIQPRQVA